MLLFRHSARMHDAAKAQTTTTRTRGEAQTQAPNQPMVDASMQTRWPLHHTPRLCALMRQSTAVSILSSFEVVNVSGREQLSCDIVGNELLKEALSVHTITGHVVSDLGV